MTRKLAVIGSRSYKDNQKAKLAAKEIISFYALDLFATTIVSGGAKGPDSWAEEVAKEMLLAKHIFLPAWKKYGKVAGLKRNDEIINEADFVLVFWDGRSKGTFYSINKALELNKPCKVYIWQEGEHKWKSYY